MASINNNLTKKILIGLLIGTYITFNLYSIVHAYSGTIFGRGEYTGYFYGVYDNEYYLDKDGNKIYYGDSVLPAVYHDLNADGTNKGSVLYAIPNYVASVGSTSTENSLIKLLYDANTSGVDQRVTGSAFIVYTMLGLNGTALNGRTKSVSSTDWTDLTTRLAARESDIVGYNANGQPLYGIQWHTTIDNGSNSVNSLYQSSSRKDDAFYTHYKSARGIRILNHDGSVAYSLFDACANPNGSLPGVPKSNMWSLSVTSVVKNISNESSKSTAKPGDTITWTHTVNNTSSYATNQSINYYYKSSGGLSGNGGGGTFTTSSPLGGGASASFDSTHLVTQSDVSNDPNKKLCRATEAQYQAWNNLVPVTSGDACVTVSYNYTLTPTVTTNPSGVIETGSQFEVTPNVKNSGPTDSKPTNWQLTRIITGSGSSDGTSVVDSDKGTKVTFAASTTTNLNPNHNKEVANYIAGTKICYTLSVTPHSSSDNTTNTSPQKCLTVGKKPKVQVWAGDVWARGLVNTSTTVKNSLTFGSWDEYGIFSAGKITGMASGSTFAVTNGLSVNSICDYSILSFTNAGTAKDCTTSQSQGGLIGNYTISHSIPDVAASFPGNGTAIAGSVNLSTKNAGIYSASNLTLDPSTLPASKTIIIKASGTVTIAGDQKYSSGPYTNITQLPQLVIIANKIVINSAVKNVDAWLIAVNKINKTGEIDTCEVVGNSINICVNPLIVNGPIMTDHLYLYRTAGSGTAGNSSDPAEVFNLRADSYLWAAAQSASNSRIQTVYTTELPPRF